MSAPRRLRVGYLQVGRERSGLRRYGAILAAEAARRQDIEVIESDIGDRDASWRQLRAATGRLAAADVVHLQWKLADWDPRLGGIPRLEVMLRSLRRPLVVTLHDVFAPRGPLARRFSPTALGLRRLGQAAASLVVHAQDERRRLEGLVPAARVEVIPHFVEVRPGLPERAAAREALGVRDRRVVTLLGYITKRRGHRLVIDALRHLPEDVMALFVGSTIEGRAHVAEELQRHATDVGVGDRVRFLGYLPEPELEQVLAATDVALCPFRAMSASGALATWISAGRPIVVSDLAPFRELDALAPGALHAFTPYEPGPLASSIRDTLEVAAASTAHGRDPRVDALARRLATPRIMDRYLGLYLAAAGRRIPDGAPL